MPELHNSGANPPKAALWSLTKQQMRLLEFIRSSFASRGIAPSYEEMKEGLGLKSKSGVYALIDRLIERGYIERLPGRARALRLSEKHGPAPQHNPELAVIRHVHTMLLRETKRQCQYCHENVPRNARLGHFLGLHYFGCKANSIYAMMEQTAPYCTTEIDPIFLQDDTPS